MRMPVNSRLGPPTKENEMSFSFSTLHRMKVIDKRMKERGTIYRVHFSYVPGNFTDEERMVDTCTALEAYLDGKCTPLKEFGDRPS